MTYQGITQNRDEPNLVPENIRKDKTIFGVDGNYEEVDGRGVIF